MKINKLTAYRDFLLKEKTKLINSQYSFIANTKVVSMLQRLKKIDEIDQTLNKINQHIDNLYKQSQYQ